MNFNDLIAGYKTSPILFVGSGLTQRYFADAPTWKELLIRIIRQYRPNRSDEYYIDLQMEHEERYDKIASAIETEFGEYCRANRDGVMKDVCDEYYRRQAEVPNKDLSFMKVFIGRLFRDMHLKNGVDEELMSFKSASDKIASIITTNYDTLIEEKLGFQPLIGNNILLTNPYHSVYKIHGCCTSPADIIITADDYQRFKVKYELIRAELISLFCHNPIIFIGYSINDENIRAVLETIYRYVEPNSEQAENVRKNFLFVKYEADLDNVELEQYTVQLSDNMNVEIHQLRTDNFKAIFDAIAAKTYRNKVADMKELTRLMLEIASGRGPELMVEQGIGGMKDSDIALAIGKSSALRNVFVSINDLISQYFDFMNKPRAQTVNFIERLNITSKQFFPIFGFLANGTRCTIANRLKDQQIERLKYALSKAKINNHKSIKDILADNNIATSYKDSAILYACASGNISLKELETYIKQYDDKQKTNYKRLLCLYDYLKYVSDEDREELIPRIEAA